MELIPPARSLRRGLTLRIAVGAVVCLMSLAIAASAQGALILVFEPTEAEVGETVLIRLVGQTAGQPLTLFLVRNEHADSVSSPDDGRLLEVGRIEAGRSTLSFVVPDVEPGDYTMAAVCPDCAEFSFGRTFSSYEKNSRTVTPEFERRMTLTIRGPGGMHVGRIAIGAAVVLIAIASAASFLSPAGRRFRKRMRPLSPRGHR